MGRDPAVAPSLGVDLTPVNVREASEIEGALAAFASKPNGGLIVTASALARVHRELIIALAARYKLPTTYWEYNLAVAGGLLSYGPDYPDQYRQAASYVDRILKGEKPGDLAVQAPGQHALTINLKIAKALGLTVPASLLAREKRTKLTTAQEREYSRLSDGQPKRRGGSGAVGGRRD
jgi:putative ABC transport system substrate-binding protein